MSDLPSSIRNAARALIIREGRILLLRKEGGSVGNRYALPGGAQEPGETLTQALVRECREEIGAVVRVRDLAYVADYSKPRDTTPPSVRQVVEFLFVCDIDSDYVPTNGPRPDKRQVAVEWVALDLLPRVTLQPRTLARYLSQWEKGRREVYLGRID